MIFKRIKAEGLAHLSYFIGSEDEAVVIDPRCDCQIYIDIAKREETNIKYVFETHSLDQILKLLLLILNATVMFTSIKLS